MLSGRWEDLLPFSLTFFLLVLLLRAAISVAPFCKLSPASTLVTFSHDEILKIIVPKLYANRIKRFHNKVASYVLRSRNQPVLGAITQTASPPSNCKKLQAP